MVLSIAGETTVMASLDQLKTLLSNLSPVNFHFQETSLILPQVLVILWYMVPFQSQVTQHHCSILLQFRRINRGIQSSSSSSSSRKTSQYQPCTYSWNNWWNRRRFAHFHFAHCCHFADAF